MNPTANYIENFLNGKDTCLNFVDCSQTTYKGRKVIMCTAIAELDTCPNCKSADDYIYITASKSFISLIFQLTKAIQLLSKSRSTVFFVRTVSYTVIRLHKSLTSIATSLTPLNVRSLSDSLKIIL